MRIFKKLAALLLCTVIIFAALPISGALTANAETTTLSGATLTYTVSDGKATITDCSTSISGDVVIPDTLGGYPVTSIGSSAFDGCTKLTSVTIPDGVTSIGSSAFNGCTKLTSVTIPDGVTSIGYNAFYNTAYYNDPSNWDNGVLYIGNHLIKADSSVAIDYSVKTSTVTIAPYAFYNCQNLSTIKIPDSVVSIGGYTFYGCTDLIKADIPNSVSYIGEFAFYNCTSLIRVNIPYGITSIRTKTFYNCTSLLEAVVPDSVTSIVKAAFENCESLSSITLPFIGYSSDSITYLGYIFGASGYGENATYVPASLKEVIITDKCQYIGYNAFYGCGNIKSITVPNSILSIGTDAFSGCDFENVYISDIEKWCDITFLDYDENPFFSADNIYLNNEILTELYLPEDIRIIGKYQFYNCQSIKDIHIPNSIVLIKQNAFYNCEGIENIYYYGTAEEWAEITVLANNECIDNAVLQFCVVEDSAQSAGDLNGDGNVNADDIALMRKALLSNTNLSTVELGSDTDINGDGATDVKDLIALKKLLA